MNSFEELMQRNQMGQLLLTILFIIYLIMGYKTPHFLANLIDSTYGKVIVITISLVIFANSNPILGVLSFFVAYNLITKSELATGTYGLNNYLPTEKKKFSEMTMYNQFPYTLEQEVVTKMAPINNYDSSNTTGYTFSPVLDDLHDAAPLNYNGVN